LLVLSGGITLKCNEKWWMTEEIVVKRLREAGTEDTGTALKKTRMMVLDALKSHLAD
jgi:hypothetical protein